MEKIDTSLVDNQLIFPSDDTLDQGHDFMGLDQTAASRTTRSSSLR